MKYSEKRHTGIPVTTTWLESLLEEMNYWVQGSKMLWNERDGSP